VDLMHRYPQYKLSDLLDEGMDLVRMDRLVALAKGVTAGG
jgi:hypothetical protein